MQSNGLVYALLETWYVKYILHQASSANYAQRVKNTGSDNIMTALSYISNGVVCGGRNGGKNVATLPSSTTVPYLVLA